MKKQSALMSAVKNYIKFNLTKAKIKHKKLIKKQAAAVHKNPVQNYV